MLLFLSRLGGHTDEREPGGGAGCPPPRSKARREPSRSSTWSHGAHRSRVPRRVHGRGLHPGRGSDRPRRPQLVPQGLEGHRDGPERCARHARDGQRGGGPRLHRQCHHVRTARDETFVHRLRVDGPGSPRSRHRRFRRVEQRKGIAVRAAIRGAVRGVRARRPAAARRRRVAPGRHRRGRGLHRFRRRSRPDGARRERAPARRRPRRPQRAPSQAPRVAEQNHAGHRSPRRRGALPAGVRRHDRSGGIVRHAHRGAGERGGGDRFGRHARPRVHG